ncbi:hypothetical protein ABT116_41330 [Streptomyces sp. NPDC002130]|uniref:hypothetical protein n=1 Tax=Streptomyces sp. NPDC002130 TaxID=3155568 RepID=UPI0033304B5A
MISSISAPWLQADMLEAARIQRGRRVLAIGSGYDAALMAELIGPAGHVSTLDISPAVTERATRFLSATGYDHVYVSPPTPSSRPPVGSGRRLRRHGDHRRHLEPALDRRPG